MSAAKRPLVTHWWWIRHAPVRDHGGRCYGQSDVRADVSDDAAFAALARALPQGALWVTTQLMRTQQTAAAIAAAGHPVPVALVEPALAEQNFGLWQGRRYEEIDQDLDGGAHKFWIAPAHHSPPEGESFIDVISRAGGAIERLTRAHAGRHIVAVAHGGTIRAALQVALDTSPERALAFAIDNLSLTRIDHVDGPGQGGQWRVVSVNLSPIHPNTKAR
ncbi:MAG: histidine phosphatase family protein [Alphaproteobacteria bacterium]|nr:histidine phosphatase family protein [Alphaproteobacteria bacterium]